MNYMQSQFKGILAKYGHNVMLQRCSKDSDGRITYSDELERHTTRFSVYNGRNLPNVQAESIEGITNTSGRVYYFLPEVNPYEGDRIYEQDSRAHDNQTVWALDSAVPMRGINGDIVYWWCGATRIRPN